MAHLTSNWLRILRKRGGLAVAGFLVVFLSGAIGSSRTVPLYEATAVLRLENSANWRLLESRAIALGTARRLASSFRPESVPADNGGGFSLGDLVAKSLSVVAARFASPTIVPKIVQDPSETANDRTQIDGILGRLTFRPNGDRSRVDVSFRSPDPAYAAAAANALVSEYVTESQGAIHVLRPAEIPDAPTLPATRRDLTIAAAGGVALALGLVCGFEYFDSRIKAPGEIEALLNLPVLGMVPAVKRSRRTGGEAPMLRPGVPPDFAEAMRAIRTALPGSSAAQCGRSVVITSTGPHEGKTLVSSSLAIALAEAGARTLAIDADMRRPRMHEALAQAQELGLSNVLAGDATFVEAARPTSVENLTLLAAGSLPPNPADLLGSKNYLNLITDLTSRYDWIVIDAPPVAPVSDAMIVANHAGVIFVVGSEMAQRQAALTAVEQLRGAEARFLGAVLNRVATPHRSPDHAIETGIWQPTLTARILRRRSSSA